LKKQYITPTILAFDFDPIEILASSPGTDQFVSIYDSNTGGNDGKGGYDPGSSLSRDNHNNSGLWNNEW
jgi:hypothetical protein